MKYQDNISQVVALQPDYLGFIFYKKSARFFDGIIPDLPMSIKKVGVFVNATLNHIIETIIKYDLQAVQLHGNESPKFCEVLRYEIGCHLERVISSGVERRKVVSAPYNETLKRHYEERNDEVTSSKETDCHNFFQKSRNDKIIEIIKVFSIKNEFDFKVLEPYEDVCDYYLFDTKGKLPGGNGYTFNWEVLKKYPSTKPYFLSGGIGIEETDNVLSFLRRQESSYCYAIDVNSKFEIKAGLKDVEQLKGFIIKF
ncbi:MAG: phosphoribosylanthranilate isomerase [Flavobacteriaceae bacterium]|nr:phosphoribosylanthranilate isomerase [Flavobacteriaceae bacterium]